MAELFNPNMGADNSAVGDDLMQRLTALKRQRLIADMLRKQATSTAQPQGQMVSGHYVAPSVLQHLAPLLQQYQAGKAESSANQAESQFNTQVGAAQRNWQSSLPQATAAVRATDPPQDIGGNMIQGPEYEKTPAQVPSQGQVLRAAMEGMRIPGNEKAAEMYAQGMGRTLEREDTRTFNRETREDNQRARADAAEESRKQQAQLQAERLAQQAELARQRSEDFRYSVDQRRQAQRDAQQATRELKLLIANSKPGKPIPNTVHKELSTLEDTAAAMAGLQTTFKDEYSGPTATIRNVVSPYDPTGTMDTSGVEWWKDYAKNASLIQRYNLFGATLNANEKASWAAADINQGMRPDLIKKNLETRAKLAQKLFANAVSRYESEGHVNIRDAFDPGATRETLPQVEGDKPGRAPAAAPVRKTVGGKTYEQRGGQWYPL